MGFPTFGLERDGPTDRPTNQRTDGRTDKASYRVACPRLKKWGEAELSSSICLDSSVKTVTTFTSTKSRKYAKNKRKKLTCFFSLFLSFLSLNQRLLDNQKIGDHR